MTIYGKHVLLFLKFPTESSSSQAAELSPKFTAPHSSIKSVHLDLDGLLSSSEKAVFILLLKEFQLVFDSCIPSYNGAAGRIEGFVNMGPIKPLPPSPPPPQRKRRVPQYSSDQLDLLQAKFDELEA